MAVAMVFGMAQNVSAAGLYTDLEEAQEALEKNCFIASELNEDGDVIMDAEIREELANAYTAAFAVYDSDRKNDLDEINAVMPALLEAIDAAQASVEEYAALSNLCSDFYDEEMAAIDEALETYDGDDAVPEALNEYYERLESLIADLKKGTATQAQLEAVQAGKTMREILAMSGIEFPTVAQVVEQATTAIGSAVIVKADNVAEYDLGGNIVSSYYKGIVIKNGKKIIRR